ncbi:sodium:alanine symporter family protein [Parachlamydia sp. AcF125]|uniref:alanine/glycine:cation symporter family protein n=1 Tax=Parachlamydia sp. AcF125 TaxID=2795736 RepID=UPI001BCA4761|nr:sodium:alanine symporter family protein [Parachlamydia sp. AcF125]MBS4167467.1 Amino-acid carrier protein AlsT [Parachlamydia sp. AcF125]
MEYIEGLLTEIKHMLWGPPLLLLLFGTGIYLTILLRGVQFRYFRFALKAVFAEQKQNSRGDISHFEALMTTLAGAIGTGTIAGVATGISVGGLGSLFWMCIAAIFGMATKYAESFLAVKYRVHDKRGEMVGGPMEYIERGLGWKWMAILFSIFGVIAAIGTGNLVQVNSIADALQNTLHFNPWSTGIGLAVVAGLVLVGGVKAIGKVAGILVPFMAILYLGAGVMVLAVNAPAIPDALYLILQSAFDGQAALGGFAGSSLMMAVQTGAARSVFTNEAGLGISSIAAAAAQTDQPGRQAMINMTGTFFSTILVCTMTGLVLAITGVLGQTTAEGQLISGASMAIAAFNTSLPGGGYLVTAGLVLFAFTTLLAWAYYGEKCFEYIFGEQLIPLYRLLYIIVIIPGAALKMSVAWNLADIANALMAFPNLIALIALSGVVSGETRSFLKEIANECKLSTETTT